MSYRRQKEKNQNNVPDFDPELLPVPASRASREPRRVRRINPLGPRVVVRVCRDANVSDGGLYLPEGAKHAMSESVQAQVVEVASALDSDTDEETNVSGIPFGAIVLIPKAAGVRVPWDDELRIVEVREILALVEEIPLT
jgi:co-chaperonin GroES (HSP10)